MEPPNRQAVRANKKQDIMVSFGEGKRFHQLVIVHRSENYSTIGSAALYKAFDTTTLQSSKMKRIRRQQDTVQAFVIPEDDREETLSKQKKTSSSVCRQGQFDVSDSIAPYAVARKSRKRPRRSFAQFHNNVGSVRGIVSDDESDDDELESLKLTSCSKYTASSCFVKQSTDDKQLKLSTPWKEDNQRSSTFIGHPLLSPPQFPNVPAGFVFL